MRTAKLLLYVALALSALGASFIYYQKRVTDQFIQEAADRKALLDASHLVWELWQKGTNSVLYNDHKEQCEKVARKNDRCNKELLQCVLERRPLKVFKKGSQKIVISSIEQVSRYQNSELAPLDGVKVLASLGDTFQTIVLESNCGQLFLPQRIYGFGGKSNPGPEERFDNFDRQLFIDKEVTASKGLTISQMRESCNMRGMQLLEGHFLDAASFHPVDLKNNRPQNFIRPPLPWTRHFKSEFVAKAQADANFKFLPEFCDYLYSKECQGKANNSLPSWMGIKDPLGNKIEVVRNISRPFESLVPSSSYFSIHSSLHRLGVRRGWKGEGFDAAEYELELELEDYRLLETGFRCMREVWID